MSAHTAAETPGARHTREWRHRKRQGAVVVNVTIGADAIDQLVSLGWLDRGRRHDREAVTAALIGLAGAAIERGVTR